MQACMVCNEERAGRSRICSACARITGVIAMAPARRRTAPCVRCNHAKLIRVVPRELSVKAERDYSAETGDNVAMYGPMFATYEIKLRTERHLLSPDESVVDPPMPHEGFGVFEAYICKGCGFVDWYCQDPDEIPIGPEYMTEEVDCTPDAPYR